MSSSGSKRLMACFKMSALHWFISSLRPVCSILIVFYICVLYMVAWGSVVFKAPRCWSDGPGIDSRWCHWGFSSVLPPTEPCALRSTQPLKVSTRDFSWGKGGLCVWLTSYHHCSPETSRKSEALIYPEPLGPPRPVEGWPLPLYYIYFVYIYIMKVVLD